MIPLKSPLFMGTIFAVFLRFVIGPVLLIDRIGITTMLRFGWPLMIIGRVLIFLGHFTFSLEL